MKNKFLKFAPIALIAIAGTACGNDTPRVTPKKTFRDTKEFIEQFEVGQEIKKADAWKIFKGDLLSSKGTEVNNASIRELSYEPYWVLSEGLEESDYEQYVHKLDKTTTFKRYNNNVYETSIDYTKYSYDPANAGDYPADGLSKTPTQYYGEGYLYYDATEPANENFHYIYTQGPTADELDPNHPYSFAASGPYNSRAKKVENPKDLADTIAVVRDDVEVSFSYYASAWGSGSDGYMIDEVSKATRTEDGFEIYFRGDICMKLYSAERVWGYEYDDDDEDYEYPLSRNARADQFVGCYVDRRIRFEYTLSFDNEGVIQGFTAYDFSYWTTLYRDTQYVEPKFKFQDPYFAYPLSNEVINELKQGDRMVVPEVLMDGVTANPYDGSEYDDYLPYEAFYVTADGVDNGEFDKAQLPDISIYRPKEDDTDVGNAWFNANDLFDSGIL